MRTLRTLRTFRTNGQLDISHGDRLSADALDRSELHRASDRREAAWCFPINRGDQEFSRVDLVLGSLYPQPGQRAALRVRAQPTEHRTAVRCEHVRRRNSQTGAGRGRKARLGQKR